VIPVGQRGATVIDEDAEITQRQGGPIADLSRTSVEPVTQTFRGRLNFPENASRANMLKVLARPKGFEPLTSAFGGQRSIQLSYGR
jgi:hypothetical protein